MTFMAGSIRSRDSMLTAASQTITPTKMREIATWSGLLEACFQCLQGCKSIIRRMMDKIGLETNGLRGGVILHPDCQKIPALRGSRLVPPRYGHARDGLSHQIKWSLSCVTSCHGGCPIKLFKVAISASGDRDVLGPLGAFAHTLW